MLIFLPLALFALYATPARWRRGTLLAISLVFYGLIQPRSLPLLLASVALNYTLLGCLERFAARRWLRRWCAAMGIAQNLLLIACAGSAWQLGDLPQILGMLVYSLSALDCILDAWQGRYTVARGPTGFVSFALYCSFFPRLYAGPLLPYTEFAQQLEEIHPHPLRLHLGFGQYLRGALKKAVLGGGLLSLCSAIQAIAPDKVTLLSSWSLVLTFALALYYTLAGYSDMAQGLGLLMGLQLPKNFYYPYQSRSITDFVQRFHMSFHSFLRRRVFDPLGGTHSASLSLAFNLMLCGMLAGLWFGFRLSNMVWGMCLALFVWLEQRAYPRLLSSIPPLFCRVYSLGVVLCSFTILIGGGFSGSLALLQALWGLGGHPATNHLILYYLSSHWLLLVAGCFFATSGVSLFADWLRKSLPKASIPILTVFDLATLLLFVAFAAAA